MSTGEAIPDLPSSPGRPTLLRAINERAALQALIDHAPLTRTRVAKLTGLSKVTASAVIERLTARGLVSRVGVASGSRGPNAQTYAVVPGLAYVVGLDVSPDRIAAATVDLTGRIGGWVDVGLNIETDPLPAAEAAVAASLDAAGVPLDRVHKIVIGIPGLVEPGTHELGLSWDLPRWRMGVSDALQQRIGRPVEFENDANAAAVAESRLGAAQDVADFVLVWLGRGIGLALMLGNTLHRGTTGAAGEIGFLPVPGAPVPIAAARNPAPLGGSFQHLVGADTVVRIAREVGITAGSAPAAVRAAVAMGEPGGAVLDELARRLALGVSSVSVVVDPKLVILAGPVGRAGGTALARRVQGAVAEMTLTSPEVVATGVPNEAVLHGVLLAGLDSSRHDILDLD